MCSIASETNDSFRSYFNYLVHKWLKSLINLQLRSINTHLIDKILVMYLPGRDIVLVINFNFTEFY